MKKPVEIDDMHLRGLYEAYSERPEELLVSDDERLIILRALDLLARVEEGEDELVRELLETGQRGSREYVVAQQAAAALVELKAELASVKAHAEAMAKELEAIRDLDGYYFSAVTGIVEAYRREFQKEEA